MLLPEVKQRFIAWCCIALLSVATALGQGLHYVAGIQHDCPCAELTSASDTGHSCEDRICPFAPPAIDESSEHDGTSTNSQPDCCSVCQLLSHMGNAVVYIADASWDSTIARELRIIEPFVLETTCFNYVARGPPTA